MTWVSFEAVRDGLSFDVVLEHYGFEIRNNGRDQVKVHCPFHNDANPSCGVNLAKKVFHCFSCQAKGNVLDFVALMEGYDPTNAKELRKAALFACETFDVDGGSKGDDRPRPKAKARPVGVGDKSNRSSDGIDADTDRSSAPAGGTDENECSLDSQSNQLGLTKPKQARRGQKRAAAASKQVGRSVPGSDGVSTVSEASVASEEGIEGDAEAKPINPPLTFQLKLETDHPFLADRQISPEIVEAFGLGVAKRGSMKDRLCFPIHNEKGELIAYAGRWLEDDIPEGTPRYLLPKGFEKRHVLYNLNRVLDEMERLMSDGVETDTSVCDTIVIVEGFWSVIRLHAFGVPVVSTFGDSVSEEQADLLVEDGFKNALLIFDGDDGGRAGTEQALPILSTRLFTKTLMLDEGEKPDIMDERIIHTLPRYAR